MAIGTSVVALQSASGAGASQARELPGVPDRAANRQVSTAVAKLNTANIAGPNREFSIALDPKTKQPVVRIVDSTTHELIDQIPSQYVLDLAQELDKEFALNNAPSKPISSYAKSG
jgi:uncharacterized FlaG/YvyC family protein